MTKVDFLIIGQGLAGTILSYHLIKNNKKILVINNDSPDSSSKVAAGIYNPITGKRFVKTWNADPFFNYLEPFYRELEEVLQLSFLHSINVYRPFSSIEDQNECMGKTAIHKLDDYIESICTVSKNNFYLNDPFGGITFKKSGYVDLPVMLKGYKKFLGTFGAYSEEIFQEEKLKVDENHIQYNNIIADKVIYCDGPESRFGRYFDYLPFKIVKGDLVVIKVDYVIDQIISKGIYIVPLGNGFYKVGATYNWSDSGKNPTVEGKKELSNKLKSLLNCPFEIVEHYAGIRPATKDRRPFLGVHPLYETLAIFNGLGSKGVSLAPYLAKQFTDFLIHKKELEKDVNINRFNSLYFN
jgi:glycine/D-amino acid oxidase-like deaminating enzyme